MRNRGLTRCVRIVLSVVVAAVAAFGLATPALAQWPTTCVALNDIVEAHLGNDGNVGIYQRVFGDQAEQSCQNDHREDVRGVFGWAFDSAMQSSSPDQRDLAWPTDCVELNDIVENHLGNYGNAGIYQRVFGTQAESACRNDHRGDVRGVFGWAFGGATSSVSGAPLSVDDVVARNQDGVLFIRAGDVCGSGAVVTRDGYVVTNRHVVEGTRVVQVGTHLGRTSSAHVVALHTELDLALLKLSSSGPHSFVAFDSSADLRLGADLMLLGYPLCLEALTITRGVLSARHSQILQTDASANPGHSGSPGFSSRGGVVGIVTAKWGSNVENTNFLIEADLVRSVIDDWIVRHRAGTLSQPVAATNAPPVSSSSTAPDHSPSDQPDYALVRQVAIARGAPDSQADAIAADVVLRGSVDAFLHGVDAGVQYGRHDCQWHSDRCPLAPSRPQPPPSDISGRGGTVSDLRRIFSGRYLATVTWSGNGYTYYGDICDPLYFWAYLHDVNGGNIQLVYRLSCNGSARTAFGVDGPVDIYIAIEGAHDNARWNVSFQRID